MIHASSAFNCVFFCMCDWGQIILQAVKIGVPYLYVGVYKIFGSHLHPNRILNIRLVFYN